MHKVAPSFSTFLCKIVEMLLLFFIIYCTWAFFSKNLEVQSNVLSLNQSSSMIPTNDCADAVICKLPPMPDERVNIGLYLNFPYRW